MKKYVLFDLDGTLTDPMVGITTCVQYALAAAGIEEPDLQKLTPFIGPPLKQSFMEFYGFSDEKAEQAVEKYRERFKDVGIFENEVYEGIPELLSSLKKEGMLLSVASSKPEVFVKRILTHFSIDSYFDAVVGSELDGRRTDKKEVVAEALKRLYEKEAETAEKTEGTALSDAVKRKCTYMVGDRKFDIIGAKAEGVISVGVTYGYGSEEELLAEKPDFLAHSVDELKEILMGSRKEKEMIPTSLLFDDLREGLEEAISYEKRTGEGIEYIVAKDH